MKMKSIAVFLALVGLTLSSCGTLNDREIISIDQGETASLEIGEGLQLSLTTLFPLGSRNVYTWSSSNEEIASVDHDGFVVALGLGTAIIKVTSNLNYTDSISISVVDGELIDDPDIIVIATSGDVTSLVVGGTLQLYPSIAGETAYDFIFNSSNPAIASVNSSGLVTAYQVGMVRITALCLMGEQTISGSIDLEVTSGPDIPPDSGYYLADSYNVHLRDVHYSNWRNTLNPIGNQKILVVPVYFRESITWDANELARLETAFFGQTQETSWESVTSYYEKTSYGKLHLSGKVTAPYLYDVTADTAANDRDISFNVAHAVSDDRFIDQQTLQEFDQDQDGFVDAVSFVYPNNYNNKQFWAWVGWNDADPNFSRPDFNTHMWVSYQFLSDGYGNSGIDAHTLIHETGHMLGLDDYYPYDNIYNATGMLDMMDNNILDHNIYSKMAMEWTYPYVVDGSEEETTIELRPFESSGEGIIINDQWNGSPLDEYLAIEFYTPTGLNQKDSQAPYPDNDLRGFTIPGIKIFHVDSRLAELTSRNAFIRYVSGIPDYDSKYYEIAAANSDEWTYTAVPAGTYKLLHLMEATGINSFKNDGIANNNTLFTAGDTFQASSTFFENGISFNNGREVGYEIRVDKITSEKATITITKI